MRTRSNSYPKPVHESEDGPRSPCIFCRSANMSLSIKSALSISSYQISPQSWGYSGPRLSLDTRQKEWGELCSTLRGHSALELAQVKFSVSILNHVLRPSSKIQSLPCTWLWVPVSEFPLSCLSLTLASLSFLPEAAVLLAVTSAQVPHAHSLFQSWNHAPKNSQDAPKTLKSFSLYIKSFILTVLLGCTN